MDFLEIVDGCIIKTDIATYKGNAIYDGEFDIIIKFESDSVVVFERGYHLNNVDNLTLWHDLADTGLLELADKFEEYYRKKVKEWS